MFSVGNVPLLAFFFALLSFTWIIAHSYSFMSLNEVFSGDLAKSSTVLMMLTWGVFGIFYSILAFIFDSYYHILFFINGCVAGVDSFFLLTHSQTRPLKVLSKTVINIFK